MATPAQVPGRPDWVSDELFPFTSRWYHTSDGHRMHYVDEGDGNPVVFLHGNPAWSFEFRHLIRELRGDYRCIAADHIGFGLSSRSDDRLDYHPKAHARRITEFLEHLNASGITLFLTDWGGPIGLEFARRRPERVKKVVIANTWCWSVAGDPHFVRFSWFMRSWVGQFMIKRLNCFVNKVVPKAIGNKAAITPAMMEHYRNALPTTKSREACAALPGHIIGASDWLTEIWDGREAFADKPALIFWGLKDIAFRKKELDRWRESLSNCRVHEYADCGHFLAEEAPERVSPALRAFMAEG